MYDAQQEYDRFGPWVMQISALDPPPPLFLPYLSRTETPLLSIKVPRNIERRQARRGMHLYDYMLTLYAGDLVILQRAGEDDVIARTCAYDDVQWLRLGKDLLTGNLHLGLRGQAYDLPFNAVSHELMGRVVDLIRGRYLPPGAPPARVARAPLPEGRLSFLFTSLLEGALEKDPPSWLLLAAQPETALGAALAPLNWRSLLFGLLDWRLTEALHFCNGRELQIYSRGKPYRYRRQKVYALDTTYVPLAAIRSTAVSADPALGVVANLLLQTAGGSISYPFMSDNPALATYAAFLAQDL